MSTNPQEAQAVLSDAIEALQLARAYQQLAAEARSISAAAWQWLARCPEQCTPARVDALRAYAEAAEAADQAAEDELSRARISAVSAACLLEVRP